MSVDVSPSFHHHLSSSDENTKKRRNIHAQRQSKEEESGVQKEDDEITGRTAKATAKSSNYKYNQPTNQPTPMSDAATTTTNNHQGGEVEVDVDTVALPESALPPPSSSPTNNNNNNNNNTMIIKKSAFEKNSIPGTSNGVTFAANSKAPADDNNEEEALDTHHHANIIIPPPPPPGAAATLPHHVQPQPKQQQQQRPRIISAQEPDDDDDDGEDIIPGPPPPTTMSSSAVSSSSRRTSGGTGSGGNLIKKILHMSPNNKTSNNNVNSGTVISNSIRSSVLSGSGSNRGGGTTTTSNSERLHHQEQSTQQHNNNMDDDLDLSLTDHHVKGSGILASRTDLSLPPEEFAAGCNLLQACAIGDFPTVKRLLEERPSHIHFRDYDRRTALHVSASEGQLAICKYLIEEKRANINRSDRWGGSCLDDAHRHRHHDLVLYLRAHGAITGSGSRATNLITAAAEGDVDEVRMLLTYGGVGNKTKNSKKKGGGIGSSIGSSSVAVDTSIAHIVNKGDYDKRTALHLAASEGHNVIVELLCQAGADVNAVDRWGFRPLDDAIKAKQNECCRILESYGAKRSPNALQQEKVAKQQDEFDPDRSQHQRERNNLEVDFDELDMVDRIGSGAFGEIFKCNWRGTLVAAKCIKSARIRQDWINKRAMEKIANGGDVDDAMQEMDEAELLSEEKEEALNDFRQEISVLKSLRHPNIVLLLAFSTTENYEVIITELMQCSLLDVFKAHIVHGTRLAKRAQISYAIQLARGMNYLHKWYVPKLR